MCVTLSYVDAWMYVCEWLAQMLMINYCDIHVCL